jgi:hypothetical protein
MPTSREKALNTVRHFRLAPGRIANLKHEKTLFATGAPTVWPAEAVARYCMRVALENGCTTIAVCQGTRSPIYFDVMSLFTYSRSLMPHGQLAVPKMKVVPPDLATKSFASVGSFTDEKKTLVTVPSLTRVSGLSGAKGA